LAANSIESGSYINILRKGFAFVESETFFPITSATEAEKYSAFNLVFADGRLRVLNASKEREN
jgi:exonuclease VII large subunit